MIAESIKVLECQRSDVYKLLSECFYQPDEKLLNKLDNLDSSDSELASFFSDMSIPLSEIGSIKIDYTKLFIGPYKMSAPPYGSLYLEDGHKLMGNSTIDVLNFYRNEELDLNLKEAPDHIAVELEFMYYLIYKETEAIIENDLKRTTIYQKMQESFWRLHLSLWIHTFTKNLQKHASTGFYKKLGYITEVFSNTEDEHFNTCK